MDKMASLYDSLQAEFCPPLDTSLLAALIADLSPSSPQSEQDTLRTTLKELASQATTQYEYELKDELDSAHLSSLCITSDESNSCADFCAETAESSNASDSSAISCQSFSSPFGFLQAALPHIPPSRLRRALSEAGAGNEGDVDMESVLETILTNEFVCELEERGLNALDDDDDELRSPYTRDDLWKRVETKKSSANGKAAKKKNARGKTITLVDIRQRQHLPPPLPAGPPAPDPWTQLSSLSDHLSTLLPPHPASFFQSHFHSPNHPSPANALRAALSSIAGTQNKSAPDRTILFTLLDVLRDSPTYASLDAEQRSSLYADAQLALRATRGRGDDAIDVVWLLLELDLDLESGTLAMGVYHVPQSPLSPSRSSAWISPSATSPPPGRDRSASTSAAVRQLPSGPPPVQPPPTSKRKSFSSSPGASLTTDAFQWQTVPQKPHNGPHPLALHIPAYDSTNQSRRAAAAGKLRGSGNGIGKGGKGDVGELTRPDLTQRMATSRKKRDELLREASKAWNRGNARTRGGEVALYFAERAREFQELARREALNEARIMVESKRSAGSDRNTIDLHGTSISEAVVIVKEILQHESCSAGTSPVFTVSVYRSRHSVSSRLRFHLHCLACVWRWTLAPGTRQRTR
ncbi:hypothetical protein OG21DRAFT_1510939 [Imleria badia]|nr:hypothetical protein OG21DRAFT_1510939 [Imleria badia]